MSIVSDIVLASSEVHNTLGTGFTENVYHRALEAELSSNAISFTSEGSIPIFYKGSPVGRRRPDLFVKDGDDIIVVELKANTKSGDGQLLQYLDLLDDDNNMQIRHGILIRFNAELEVLVDTV